MLNWSKIQVAASRPYSIILGAGLESVGEYLQNHVKGISRIVVITHQSVSDLYLGRLLDGLKDYAVDVLIVPQGEEEKSLNSISILTADGVRAGMDRHSLVIALGGGVIGDLAGFFASIYMRGVRFLQIPTTLLAQVDSSIGGKVAVNHPAGKNLLGAFYPPQAVWLDFSTLDSLPWAEVQNGMAECIKHAILGDRELFDFFEKHVDHIRTRDSQIWREMVTRSLAVKVRIVTEDEQEHGVRALLNLGHSFGHALEAAGRFQKYSHGQGVSIGMVAAAYLAQARDYLHINDVERIILLLKRFGLPTAASGESAQQLLSLMAADKKNQAGHKILILPKAIGQAVISRDCRDEEILAAWAKVLVD